MNNDMENFKMDINEYIKERVEDQIKWYDKKSSINQKIFKRLRIIEIVAATSVPFLSGFVSGEEIAIKVIIGLLGLIIAIIAGVISLFHFQENWTEYRTTCEMLKHEKYLFITNVKRFDTEDANLEFIAKIESIISKENSKWSQYISKKEEIKQE